MKFEFSIPTNAGPLVVDIKQGGAAVFVGANGGGKTRLSVLIEDNFAFGAHRISAHRSLNLNPSVAKISEASALAGLRTGYADPKYGVEHRLGGRWQSSKAVALLNDFDYLIQALFANQSNRSLITHKQVRSGDFQEAVPTKFEELSRIWHSLLPHRELHVSGDDIQVSSIGSSETYDAREMSDGERSILYLIGQVLVAQNDSLLIIDEPELHMHRSVMSKLWDELEAIRQDCAFVFITHDLEFAASRVAQKFVISSYQSGPIWGIEAIPDDTGFSEETTTFILGSRRPILFVEGGNSSLDIAIYRACYEGWTIIPRGSCQEVIHSVVTMRKNENFTRVKCSGIVDADAHSPEDRAYLKELGIDVLPVSEIENIIFLSSVSRAIAEQEGYSGDEMGTRLEAMEEAVFSTLSPAGSIDKIVSRYCTRRIDRLLKNIDLSGAKNISAMIEEYNQKTTSIDIQGMAEGARARIQEALTSKNINELMATYDNKGLLAHAASHLRNTRLHEFEAWLVRILRNGSAPKIVAKIKEHLPEIHPG